MIVCKQCAFQNLDDDSFCGSCGSFLEWTGEQVAPPQPDTVPEEAGPKRSLLSRVQTALALDVHAPGEVVKDDPAVAAKASGPGAPGAGPGRPGGPPGGAGAPGAAPGGPPRSAGPPSAPGAGGPPRPPGPPSAPGAGGPPRPPGAPSAPGTGAPPRPPGAPPRAPSPPSATGAGGEAPQGLAPPADMTGLVARNATAPTPQAPPAGPPTAPRPVARTSVSSGETTIGAPTQPAGGETPAAVQPGAITPVKPSAPVGRAKPAKQAPTRKVLPGDLICGDCGEGNPPARNFCSRCGAALKDAAVAKRKWWQRLIPRRRRKAMEAGARPWKTAEGSQKQRRKGGALAKVYLKLRPIVAAALLLAGLLIGFSPNLREKVTGRIGDAKDSVMDRLSPTYVPLQPISIQVTSETPEQPGANVIDSNTITYWIAPNTDREPAIVVRFDEPFDLERIKIWNGAAVGFKDHERVRDIHFVFDTGQSYDLVVNDLPDGQEYEVKNGQGVREVELHIVGTYSSLAADDVGLSEIEFYFKR